MLRTVTKDIIDIMNMDNRSHCYTGVKYCTVFVYSFNTLSAPVSPEYLVSV